MHASIIEAARKQLGQIELDVAEDLLESPAADAMLSAAAIRKCDLIAMGCRVCTLSSSP